MILFILAGVFTLVGFILLYFFLNEKCKNGYTSKEIFIKAFVSIFFLAVAEVGVYNSLHHPLPIYIIIGLFFGLLGDIFLEYKYYFPKKAKFYTYAGFIVFLIGHILYIGGMIHEYYHGENVLYIILPIVIGFTTSGINLLLEKKMKLDYKDMKVIVFLYGGTLFSMALTALSLLIINGFTTTLLLILIGGVFFAVSDLILSGTYFGKDKERPIDFVTNSTTYYIAQYLIAFSLLFI